MALRPTASQTVGPYFHIGLTWDGGHELVAADRPDSIRIAGTVFDGDGTPVDDALIELWQANAAGRYAHPEDARTELALEDGYTGFGRCQTDGAGRFEFVTVKPGALPGQAPQIAVSVFARGVLKRLATRIYFPDEEEANAADPVLSSIADDALRATLVAVPKGGLLRFDVHLQGDHETAFLDV